MGVKERREREKSETRDKILDAARELFVTEGFEGVSMRKVAEKIEYSPTAIYVHFADKQELFRELCHQDYARLAEVFQSSAMSTDPIERLKQIGAIYIDFGTRYPNHYRFMFMTPHPPQEPDEVDREMMGNPEMDAYAFLKWAVQQAIDAGCFREELTDAELISQTLWASVHGVIALHIAKGCDAWVDWRPLQDRAAMMPDVTLRGLIRQRGGEGK
ncbi:MAG TPA: TetR/AcrR family transcriptional regulator [Candidatus Sulfotelmatobacter sp.]|jgi:AcrR family transcriptional regulator|nr:TetR/AcrR family transcriptional regulator [Candidatus Sulfotelmatobacter sp.]